jgi:hypothetical protein
VLKKCYGPFYYSTALAKMPSGIGKHQMKVSNPLRIQMKHYGVDDSSILNSFPKVIHYPEGNTYVFG